MAQATQTTQNFVPIQEIRDGVAILKTGGMRGNTRRRILETAQFVFDVLNLGAFTATGRGVRSTQKVRLMHATIRHLTLMEGQWDSKSWGVPLNQEDLAGTLMTFSVVVLDVFESVGVRLVWTCRPMSACSARRWSSRPSDASAERLEKYTTASFMSGAQTTSVIVSIRRRSSPSASRSISVASTSRTSALRRAVRG